MRSRNILTVNVNVLYSPHEICTGYRYISRCGRYFFCGAHIDGVLDAIGGDLLFGVWRCVGDEFMGWKPWASLVVEYGSALGLD